MYIIGEKCSFWKKCWKNIGKKEDTLKTLSEKIVISLPYLSGMEVGRKIVTLEVVQKIKEVYSLTEEEYNTLYMAMLDSNNKVDIELSKMNEAQREVSMVFARKIENADPELIEKLRKVLMDSDDQN